MLWIQVIIVLYFTILVILMKLTLFRIILFLFHGRFYEEKWTIFWKNLGPHGAEITCKSDSIEIGVSTVNPFYGHMYVVGQFNRPECVVNARNSSREIRLTIGLNSCNIQKQFMVYLFISRQQLLSTLLLLLLYFS